MRRLTWVLGLLALVSLAACAGEDGKAGEPGEAGQPGTNGTNGEPGDEGAPGAPGAPGADGAAPSAADVTGAVQTVFDEQLGTAVQDAVADELGAREQGCDTIDMDPSEFDGIYQVEKHLEPGEETEVCAIYKTGDDEIWMNSGEQVLAAGSHHGLLWLTDLTELPEVDNLGNPVEIGKMVDCDGIAAARFTAHIGGQTWPIVGSQGAGNFSRQGVLPEDVAIRIPANSYVVADIHMLNATDAPIEACMKVGLRGIPKKEVEHEAGPFFFYNPMITVPAEDESVARQACEITQDVTLKTAVSHMHARGVGYEAVLLDGSPFGSGTEEKRKLYETEEWEEPEDAIFDKALKLEAGDWIDYRCEYDNREDRIVANNTQTVDEMCMFIGIFWPYDRDLSFCAHADEGIGNSAGLNIGEGDGDGADFLGCWWGNVSRPGATDFISGGLNMSEEEYEALYDFQSCFTESCEAIGEFTRPYSGCAAAEVGGCQLDCTDAQTQYQTLCAVTPAAGGGCAEKYGTTGANGTCATGPDTTNAAVAICMEDIRQAAIEEVCLTLPNAAQGCAEDCAADPAATGCTDCLGTIDFDAGNTNCLNLHTLGCMQEEIPPLAEACATECFTGCITEKVTNCVVTCVNEDRCLPEVTGLMTTDCD